jgi:acetyltransferase
MPATDLEPQPTTPAKPGSNILRYEQWQPLDAIFAPRSVAVVGATEKQGSVGRTILWNLISSPFGGTVFPVNPKRTNVLGIRAYPSVADIPEPPELAVIVTPAPPVPGLIRECGEAGVRGAIVISAGFKEAGPEGVELERRTLEEARHHRMRIVGPNCLGVMSPLSGLNATFAAGMARPGNVGFISQSGALCTAVLDWSFRENVGFSAFVSVGSMVDVGWGDLIDYLGGDPRTRSIVIYMESIGNARSFLSAAREVALTKPIIVIKAGRTQAAAMAAASHTGALTGSDEVLEAAFRRCGVLRVDSIADLFYMAEVLAKQPRPRGPRLTILTNAGGPGVLATDALISNQGQLAEFAPETMEAFNEFLPAHWSHANPADILGDATPDRYAKSLEVAQKDPSSDGLLVVLTPQSMTDPTQTAEQLKHYAETTDKPLLASWMGGSEVSAGEAILNRMGIPTFAYPDTAARVFTYMWRYSSNLRALYETPMLPGGIDERSVCDEADALIRGARDSGRTILTESESKQVLSAYGIPTVPTRVATTEDEAVGIAGEFGYPVVVKLHSKTITHKSDVDGVRLNIADEEAVREAFRGIQTTVGERASADDFLGVAVQPMVTLDGWEIILGSSVDPQFGPVILFGAGGQMVEVFRDRALGLPPQTTTLARRMMERTKVFSVLKGARGKAPVDIAALEQLIVRFSHLVVEQPWIKEVDINPLLASADRLVALDARVVLHGPEVAPEDLPTPAITPYPTRHVSQWTLQNGSAVTIRPIRSEDEPLMAQFHETLSERSVYLRYLHTVKLDQRIAHERLTRICFIDYDREMALVAQAQDPTDGTPSIVGVARLTKIRGANEAEFAVLIADQVQRQGLGRELLERLVGIGREWKLDRITGEILPQNLGMQHVARQVGFECHLDEEEGIVKGTMTLGEA